MPNFEGASAEDVADFFQKAKGMTGEQLVCLSNQFLEKYQEIRDMIESNVRQLVE